MTRDLEAALRRALTDRAGDVTPDPQLWSRVQSRVRRSRNLRFAFAGGLGALAFGAMALGAPGLLDRRIEFEPRPFASQPAPVATQATPVSTVAPVTPHPAQPAAAPGSLVFTDGTAVYSMALDGESAEVLIPSLCPQGATCNMALVRSVAAHGGGAVSDTAAVAAHGCGGLRYATGSGSQEPIDWYGACTPSAAFSPDGRHLVWVAEAEDGQEASLKSVDWTDAGPGTVDADFGLPWAEASEVSIQDWVWTEESGDTAAGYLALRGRREGVIQLLRLPVERQADGALAVTGRGAPILATAEYAPLAFAASGPDVTYTLEARLDPQGPADGKIVRRTDGSPDVEVAVPDKLMSGSKFNESDLWMSAVGDTVVFGNAGTATAWYIDSTYEGEGPPPLPTQLTATIVHADLLVEASGEPPIGEGDTGGEGTPAQTEVDVYFGMTGADACVADQPVTREVEGAGVARGAITELLEGPDSRESNEGIRSPFTANTAGALNDITIVDGQARVDFDDFSAEVGNDSCSKAAIVDSLNKTLFQFDTIASTLYSFDGDFEAWNTWLGLDLESPPGPVVEMQKAIYDAALGQNWAALRRLSEGTSCTLSDQPEPCVPYWKDQEQRGEDPLGTLVDLLEMPAAKHPDAPMWVWPEEWAAGKGYNGPRIGIDRDGVWRYYVQQGG